MAQEKIWKVAYSQNYQGRWSFIGPEFNSKESAEEYMLERVKSCQFEKDFAVFEAISYPMESNVKIGLYFAENTT